MPRDTIFDETPRSRRATTKKARKTSSRAVSKPRKRSLSASKSARKDSVRHSKNRQTEQKSTEHFVQITLQTRDGEPIVVTSSKEFQRAAVQWSYVLRNRRRWNTSEADITEQALRAKEQLKTLGIREEQLQQLAKSAMIEVSIPYSTEAEGWETRIFPWEYMLSAATRSFRDGKLWTIVRHLKRQEVIPTTQKRKISKALIVESAPGEVRKYFSFESERQIVKANLDLSATDISIDETRDALRDRIATYSPDIIHLAGVDNNQAAAKGWIDRNNVFDGYLMKAIPDGMEGVTADDLAAILNAAQKKPALVSSNIYYSAARIGALAVAGGAEAAIGFQDELDDALMELFFANFYDAWHRLKWDLLEAFTFALAVLKGKNGEITPTGGIVLWSDRSLLKPVSERTSIKSDIDSEKEKIRVNKEKVLTLKDFPDHDGRQLLSIEVKSCPSLNYSILHNNGRLFEKFLLRKEKVGRLTDICVEVVLYVGKESSRFSCATDMVDSPLDLNQLIHVPLIYSTELMNNENIHTGLYVEITWQNQVLHRQTYRVTLPPLDEWRGNDDLDRVWLPSFLLPRDPMITRIVDAAQNYVMTLRDDSRAGFDGYQCVIDNDVTGVDLQVRALWSALIYNFGVSYINPPPTYNLTAQRLRTPTEIIEGRRGTCIDLALLFAACLEYVDIYPVMFLLKNHAFPGFWRSSGFQEDFRKVIERSQTVNGADPGDLSTVQRWPWYHSMNAYEEIMNDVNNGRLVPLETIGLTQRGSYEHAIDEAIKKLENEGKINVFAFEGMIDVNQARKSLITPIPRR